MNYLFGLSITSAIHLPFAMIHNQAYGALVGRLDAQVAKEGKIPVDCSWSSVVAGGLNLKAVTRVSIVLFL